MIPFLLIIVHEFQLDERESRASSSGVTGSVDGSSMTGPSPAPDNDASSALQEVEQESAVTHYLVLKKFSDGTYLIKGITKLSQLAALCQKHKVCFFLAEKFLCNTELNFFQF